MLNILLQEDSTVLFSIPVNNIIENLENETRKLYSIIHDQDLIEVPVINKSKHEHFEEYYTEETKNIVANLYKEDITLYKEILNAQNIECI